MNRTGCADMYRTEHIKYTMYPGDGGGRDHHVLYNNGGLTISNYPKRNCGHGKPGFDNL